MVREDVKGIAGMLAFVMAWTLLTWITAPTCIPPDRVVYPANMWAKPHCAAR
jgi:hypothetical protein